MGAEHLRGDGVDAAPGRLAVRLALHHQLVGLLQVGGQRAAGAGAAPAGHGDLGAGGGGAGRQADDAGVVGGADRGGEDEDGDVVVDGAARVLLVLVDLLHVHQRAAGLLQAAVADGEDGGPGLAAVDAVG